MGALAIITDLVEPYHRCVVAGVAEGFQFVVPCRAQRDVQLPLELERVTGGDLQRVADTVLADDHIAGGIRLGVVDAETGRVQPAAAVAARRGILGHLESQVLPAADRGGQRRSGAGCALPVVLGTAAAREDGLVGPVEVHRSSEGTPHRPFEVGAQRAWRRVNIDHSTRLWCRHDLSVRQVRLPQRPETGVSAFFGCAAIIPHGQREITSM